MRFERCRQSLSAMRQGLCAIPERKRAGCSEAWLSHVLWEHETVGSNPTTPTIPADWACAQISSCRVPAAIGTVAALTAGFRFRRPPSNARDALVRQLNVGCSCDHQVGQEVRDD